MSTVQDVYNEVRRVIHDESAPFRWSDSELLTYVNAAERQTVTFVPDANTIETIIDTLTSRVARQSLPAGGISFIKVSRNYADDGTTPQGVVRYVEKDALDTFEPTWEYVSAKADGANYFEHYCHDSREGDVFYLFPAPAVDNKRVAIVYSAVPTALTDATVTLSLDDVYFNATVQYTIYRALTKESRETLPGAFRQELWQNYLVALGLQKQAEDEVTPANNRAPEGE
jgi:hypothetical protein